MRVFIELPTWLGDSVMASAAIENLVQNEKNLQIVFFGSFVACELYKSHPNCEALNQPSLSKLENCPSKRLTNGIKSKSATKEPKYANIMR